MGATLDQFDTIDFSDNDIRKIDGFAYLKRLKNIIFNNNAIMYVNIMYFKTYLKIFDLNSFIIKIISMHSKLDLYCNLY